MGEFANIRYHIEVEHDPGCFEQDMDFLSSNLKSAYEHYQNLKKKYLKQKINITEITEIVKEKTISAKRLEKLIFSRHV